jgi:hypothetical protein
MPFKKGDPQSIAWAKMGGRPGYEIEEKQLAEMRKELSQFLILTEKIRTKKASKEDIAAYEIISKPICKMMDKLHANKVMLQGDKDKPLEFSILTQEQIDELFKRRTKKDSTGGQV